MVIVGGSEIILMGVNDDYNFNYLILVTLSAITTYSANIFFFRAV